MAKPMEDVRDKLELVTYIDLNYPFSKKPFDCLIVLNGECNAEQLKVLCEPAQNILLADGGANNFVQCGIQDLSKVRAIVGDLDSVKPENVSYFCQRGVELIRVEDQNYNDFQKAIMEAMKRGWKSLVAVGAFGTRMDHTLGAMSQISKQSRLNPHLDIVLISGSSLVCLIKPNNHYKLNVGKWVSWKGCGLIPFGKVRYIETTGFKWNLGKESDFSSLEWGDFISSSNEITNEEVSVFATEEIFFMCNFEK